MVLGRNKFIGSLAVTIMLAATIIVGFAHQSPSDGGKHGHRSGGVGRLFSGLDLSETQQTQIQSIAARYEQSNATLREQLRTLHNSSSATDSTLSGTFNEAQVRQAAQARAALQVELEVASARMKSEMYAVLTSEQRSKLAEQRQQWEQRRGQQHQQRRGSSTPSATTL